MTYSVKISASYPFVFCMLTNINGRGGGGYFTLFNQFEEIFKSFPCRLKSTDPSFETARARLFRFRLVIRYRYHSHIPRKKEDCSIFIRLRKIFRDIYWMFRAISYCRDSKEYGRCLSCLCLSAVCFEKLFGTGFVILLFTYLIF